MINSCSFASSNSEKEFSYSYIHIKYSASRISAVMWRKVHVWFKIRWTSWYFWRTRKLLEAEHTSPQNANHTKQHQLYPTTANLFLCATSSCFHFLNKVFLPRFLATSVMARYHHRCISVGSVNGHGDWDLTDKIKKTLAGGIYQLFTNFVVQCKDISASFYSFMMDSHLVYLHLQLSYLYLWDLSCGATGEIEQATSEIECGCIRMKVDSWFFTENHELSWLSVKNWKQTPAYAIPFY